MEELLQLVSIIWSIREKLIARLFFFTVGTCVIKSGAMANGIEVELAGEQLYHQRRRVADKCRGAITLSSAANVGSRVHKSPKRGSPTILGHYAGAKFSEPPEAAALPKPPVHWTLDLASHQLKLLLNVQA